MTFNTKGMMSSITDDWRTPSKLYQELDKEFHFDYDPCPLFGDKNPTGLKVPWGKSTYCNPPYSKIKEWIKKGFEEWQLGKTIVFLIPSRTDTKWWHEYIMKATEIRFIKGRLKFNDAKGSAPFPSAIIVFKSNEVIAPASSQL